MPSSSARRTLQLLAACAAVIVLAGGAAQETAAQVAWSHGQSVVPVYEGWEQNPDGSFNLVFGYYNRNQEEELDIPVGPGNFLEPGAPDQGQPTHFYPQRSRFLFRVRVGADFGDGEVVWTLVSNGRTERAYGTLKTDYYIDDIVVMNNNGAGGQAGGGNDLFGNAAPSLQVDGDLTRRVRVGEPVQLTARASDDGIPAPRAVPFTPLLGGRCCPDAAAGFAPVVVRVPRCERRRVRPAAVRCVGELSRLGRFTLCRRLGNPAGSGGRQVGGAGDRSAARARTCCAAWPTTADS